MDGLERTPELSEVFTDRESYTGRGQVGADGDNVVGGTPGHPTDRLVRDLGQDRTLEVAHGLERLVIGRRADGAAFGASDELDRRDLLPEVLHRPGRGALDPGGDAVLFATRAIVAADSKPM